MNGYKQIRVFDRDLIRSLYSAAEQTTTRMKESLTQQQYAIRTISEKIETARQKKKGGEGPNNDGQNAEVKQATLAGRRAHRCPCPPTTPCALIFLLRGDKALKCGDVCDEMYD